MEEQEMSYSNEKYICPKCGGIGWILTTEIVPDYGEVEYAERCPDCARRYRATDDTGMPLQYVEADLPSFNFDAYGCDMSDFRKTVWSFTSDFLRWEDRGMGLYLCSETPGSGKTLLACSVARSVSIKFDVQMRFVTATDYLSIVGDSYHRSDGDPDRSAVYRRCGLLVLDDLGAQKSGSWQDQEMFRLINDRLTSGKVTIITSNVPQDELKMDARTIDRIISCTLPLALPEISIRRKQAQAKQTKIMNEVLNKDEA